MLGKLPNALAGYCSAFDNQAGTAAVPPIPPASTTVGPPGSWFAVVPPKVEAVKYCRADAIVPVAVKVPVAGSYNSALER
jgi:hypothetical protein